jgi:hypothetical protein
MQTATIKLKRPHAGQRAILDHPARFKVAACGRRFGKSELGKQALIDFILRGKRAWWISPSFRMASQAWGALKDTLYPIIAHKNETLRTIRLTTGGELRVQSGHDPDSLRGDGLDFAVLDEAAFLHPDVWQAAIRPALADRRGEAMFLSTPNGRNWFWTLYMLGQDVDRKDWQSWRLTTSANPIIAADEIEASRELLPDRLFRQEFLAEFTDDAGAVFRNVTGCATATAQDGPRDGGRYVFGVDWAKDYDYTVITVLDRDARTVAAVDRFNKVDWSTQRGRLAALAALWQPEAIWAEANSIGGPNIEALQAEGLPVIAFQTTAQSKGPLIESLALAFERSEIAIYDDPVLVGELQAFAMERLPSGRYRYGAPSGLHDDAVISLALAWHGAQFSGVGIDWV